MHRFGYTLSAFIAAIGLALGAASTSFAQQPNVGNTINGPSYGLRFVLRTPSHRYTSNQDVPFVATAKNVSDRTIEWDSNGCPVDLQVQDASGNVVWHPTEICPEIIIHHTLQPGETASWPFTWTDSRPAGLYAASATLNGVDVRSFPSTVRFRVVNRGGLQFNLTTAFPVYGTNDKIPFVATVKNVSKRKIEWYSGGCPVDLQVQDASGKVVWHPTEICTDIAIHHVLRPGESASWSFTWTDSRPLGSYVATAVLNGKGLRSSARFQVAVTAR
jgi:hypothetical protein